MFAMTSIKGIGRRFANICCKKADVDMDKRAGESSAAELDNLMTVVAKGPILVFEQGGFEGWKRLSICLQCS
jgi:ribosomal protein S13